MERMLEFNGRQWSYSWWSGQRLKGTADCPFSFDTETALIRPIRQPLEGEDPADVPLDPLHVPPVALMMACDQDQLFLIHPSKIREFVAAHRRTPAVAHNLAFDWHVLRKDALDRNDALTVEFLWQWAEEGRLCDSMLLDMLLQLATGRFRRMGGSGGEQKLYPTNLGVLTAEWECGELDKSDPFRLRFGELIGLSEQEIDSHPEAEGFFVYSLKDVLACRAVYQKQRVKALELMRKAGWSPDPKQVRYEMRPDCVEKWGVLSEKVQVCASIVLAELGRTPIPIDQEKRQRLEIAARERHRRHLNSLLERTPDLIKKSKAKYKTVKEGKGKSATKTKMLVKEAEVLYTAKAGVPQFNQSVLVAVLTEEADRLGVDLPISKGKERRTSTSTKQWKHLSAESPFIQSWVSLEEEGKLIEDLRKIDAPQVWSKYDLLKVTGRTGSGHYAEGRTGRLLLPSLNIQNVKRDSPDNPDDSMRHLFLAPEGYLWAPVDYAYVEIRAMAAVAKAMYGWSKMAEIVAAHTGGIGADPHQTTAANVIGVTIEEFLRLDKPLQKKRRQEAKVANFGLMGGMGANTLCEYAKAQGVELTVDQARDIKRAFKATYPEMEEYLRGNVYDGLMWETDRKTGPKLKDNQQYRLSEFLKTTDGDDPDYDPEDTEEPTWSEKQQFWQVLEWAAKVKGDAQTQEDVRRRRVTQKVRRLTYYRSATLTGRIRNYCSYTELRNHRFQAVAADGAKMAMFRIMRLADTKKWKLLNFVHDELGVALPASQAPKLLKEVERIMITEMEKVLGHGVPVAVEGSIAPCWSKS